jgi:hypothetical protein
MPIGLAVGICICEVNNWVTTSENHLAHLNLRACTRALPAAMASTLVAGNTLFAVLAAVVVYWIVLLNAAATPALLPDHPQIRALQVAAIVALLLRHCRTMVARAAAQVQTRFRAGTLRLSLS